MFGLRLGLTPRGRGGKSTSPLFALKGKLNVGEADASLLIVGDSTGDSNVEWVYLFTQYLADSYPEYSVEYFLWDDTDEDYDTPESIQTGTGSYTLRVYNCSISGSAPFHVMGTKFQKAILDIVEPDLVIWSHGHNVFGMGEFVMGFEPVREAWPSAAHVAILQNPRLDSEFQAERVAQIKALASAYGDMALIDVYSAFNAAGRPPEWYSDNTHPNGTGQAVWLEVVKKAFDKAGGTADVEVNGRFFSRTEESLVSNPLFSNFESTLPTSWGSFSSVATTKDTTTVHPGSSARTCRVFQTTGDANNRMRFSIYFKPINAISRYPNPPDTTEEDRDVRLHIVTESSHLGGAVSVNMRTLEFEGTAFLEAVAYGLDDVGSGWYRVWFTADKSPSGVGNNFIYLSNRVGITFDPYPDGTEEVWIYGPMLEFGDDVDLSQPPGPYQKVTTAYDVTEEGVPSVYHILDDGSDTIDVVLPAGNYDVAYVESDGAVSYDTVTSDGSTPLSTLFAERQVDVIVKSGTFSQGEKDAIEYFWARYS